MLLLVLHLRLLRRCILIKNHSHHMQQHSLHQKAYFERWMTKTLYWHREILDDGTFYSFFLLQVLAFLLYQRGDCSSVLSMVAWWMPSSLNYGTLQVYLIHVLHRYHNSPSCIFLFYNEYKKKIYLVGYPLVPTIYLLFQNNY